MHPIHHGSGNSQKLEKERTGRNADNDGHDDVDGDDRDDDDNDENDDDHEDDDDKNKNGSPASRVQNQVQIIIYKAAHYYMKNLIF